MNPRRGGSLGSKLILTTTGLIVAVVALFGVVNALHMARVYDAQSQQLAQVTMNDLRKRGEVQTRDLVQASRSAALQSDYSTLQGFVPELAPADDREVAYAFVADRDGLVLAHSDRQLNGKPVSDAVGKAMIAADEPKAQRFDDTPQGKLLVFSRPILHESRKMGSVAIAFRLAPLDEQLAHIAAEKAAATRDSTRRTVLLGLVFVLFGSALAVLQAVRIGRPLSLLAARAQQIAQGDLQSRVEVASRDEIGRLGESFNFMADQLVVMLRENAAKAALEKELEVARAIQETLVPPESVVERAGLTVAGHFTPASECGGDWWTVHELSPGRMLVVIGDVTGHGAPAAMITACAKAACDTVRSLRGDALTAGFLLETMNRAIFETARRKFLMTCFASIIDVPKRTVTFANAGHNFPYLVRPSATGTDGLQVLMARGNPLGDAAEASFAEHTQVLEPGDVLVWYTDGVIECESERGEEFGDKRFRAALRQSATLGPRELRDRMVAEATAFYGARPQKDDITMVFGRLDA